MSKHISVTVDGSPLSLHALPVAGAIARPGDVIELVTAVDPVPPFPVPGYAEAAARWVAKRHEEVTPLLGVEGCEVRSTYLERAARGLPEHLEHTRPDVLVLATHGRGPVSRNWLGSTADRLARSGLAPLLVVRPEDEEDPQPVQRLRRVLVPLDGSELAEGAVHGALRLLGEDIELILVRVVEAGALPGTPYIPDQIRLRREAEEEAARYMDQVVARFRTEGRSVEGHVRPGDRASVEIVAAAEAADADAIGICTHGRGGLVRAALGSVTDKVIRIAARPVLVLPADTAAGE